MSTKQKNLAYDNIRWECVVKKRKKCKGRTITDKNITTLLKTIEYHQ